MQKIRLLMIVMALVMGIPGHLFSQEAHSLTAKEMTDFENQLCEIPFQVQGVRQPVFSLNGHWEFSGKSVDLEAKEHLTQKEWKSIEVPGEPAMQGFAIEHDKWYAYRKQFKTPKDYQNKRVLIRFNGVYSQARLWVNGVFLREHHGGFTSWECDLTPFVKKGKEVELVVAFCDRTDEISFGSGYAKHCIGGILRDVELIALPNNYISQLKVETHLDSLYKDSKMSLYAKVSGKQKKGSLRFSLYGPKEKLVFREELKIKDGEVKLNKDVADPLKWCAERPHLYDLKVELLEGDTPKETVSQKIGFRAIEVKGQEVLVNGMPVKLRGACRHDIHPLMGRSTTAEYDLKDVLLAKEANMNFIRTSHYPPTRQFLEYCDRYGMYVEEETAVCFVKTWKGEPYNKVDESKDDDSYRSRYLGQLAEMVERDWNHSCVLMWSIGNENTYGKNFGLSYDYVRAVDTTRPIIFSYPGTTGGKKVYDIVSIHYVNSDGQVGNNMGVSCKDFSVEGMPTLHDEWAHVACYNTHTLKEDPGVRDFWGASMARMWDGCFDSKGGLGGAIWGMTDETFMLPDTVVGYGEWGFIDTWRRKKPEFWHTKKAHSPIKLLQTRFKEEVINSILKVPVYNRFDHVNLNEVKVLCDGKPIEAPNVAPHQKGSLAIPEQFTKGEPFDLQFFLGKDLIDRYVLSFEKKSGVTKQAHQVSELVVEEKGESLMVKGARFKLIFSKETGLLTSGLYGKEEVLHGGPYLNVVVARKTRGVNQGEGRDLIPLAKNWELLSFTYSASKELFQAHIQGRVDGIGVNYNLQIDGSGLLGLTYSLKNKPDNVHQVGLSFILNKSIDRLEWEREAQWTYYPEDHIGRPKGVAHRYAAFEKEKYRKEPQPSYAKDGKNFFLCQVKGTDPQRSLATNDFRSTKMHFLRYALTDSKKKTGVLLEDDGILSARSEVDPQGNVVLKILNVLTYGDLAWGNYTLPTVKGKTFQGSVSLRLIGK